MQVSLCYNCHKFNLCVFCFLMPFCPVFEGFLGFIVYIIDSVFGYACFIILLTVWIFSASSLNFQGIFLSLSLLFNVYSWSPLTPPLRRSSGSRSQDYFCRAWTWRTTKGDSGIFSMSETESTWKRWGFEPRDTRSNSAWSTDQWS